MMFAKNVKFNYFPSDIFRFRSLANSTNSEHSRWTGFLRSERLYNQPYMYDTIRSR